MEYTGERPTLEAGYISSQRRYKALIPYCQGKHTLDLGCGVGHGTSLLSDFVPSIIGYDISKEATAEATLGFGTPTCTFTHKWKEIDLDKIEIFASVECIEHIEKPELHDLLAEVSAKVPSLVATTPSGNLYFYNPRTKQERRGFHVWHYTKRQLTNLLNQYYRFVIILGVDYDDSIRAFTSFLAYATNEHANWKTPRYDTDF